MIGMSDAVMPVVSGMEVPLPFAPLGDECVVLERPFHHAVPPKEMPQWEQFEKYPQSLVSVVKSLGDGIELAPVVDDDLARPKRETLALDRVSTLKDGYVHLSEPSRQSPEPVAASRVSAEEKPSVQAVESHRAELPARAEVKEVEKPLSASVATSRVPSEEKPSVQAAESPRAELPARAEVKDPEKPLSASVATSRVPSEEKPLVRTVESPRAELHARAEVKDPEKPLSASAAASHVQALDIIGVRAPENIHVQTLENASVSRLVETVIETMAVTPSLSAGGEGEIRIRLKSDILDGSSIKIEVKDGELKVVVMPASRVAEEMLLKSQESFQNQLAERVTAWRINVGVAAFDLRNHGRHRLEDEA